MLQSKSHLVSRLLVIWIVISTTFFMLRLLPGNAFDGERKLPEEIRLNLERYYELDLPLYQQYLNFWTKLFKGDLGPSYRYKDKKVQTIIGEALPESLKVGFFALLLSVILGISLGGLASYYNHKFIGKFIDSGALFMSSIPSFLIALILILILSLWIPLFPTGLNEGFSSMILPVLTLSVAPTAYLTRISRVSFLEHSQMPCILSARARGIRSHHIFFNHFLRLTAPPLLTVLGPMIALLITGSFVVEYIFVIPGIGRHFVQAVINRDYPLVLGVTLIYTMILLTTNGICDYYAEKLSRRKKESQGS